MNPAVDRFLKESKQWRNEIARLRAILLKSRLEETLKWNLPCYTHQGANIAIIQPFKACLGLMFFKGSLLKDPKRVLVDNGPNSQAARRLEFRSVQEITRLAPTLQAYLKEAMAIEDAGLKVEPRKKLQAAPPELKKAFARDSKLKKAFDSLTPGRQRAYLLHFSGAKQPATRQARIEKCAPRILQGKGLTDR